MGTANDTLIEGNETLTLVSANAAPEALAVPGLGLEGDVGGIVASFEPRIGDQLLLLLAERLPDLLVDRGPDVVHQVAGQDDLVGDLVELGVEVRRQRVVLTIDRAGLERQVELAERDRRGVGPECLTHGDPAR